jgi:hypothetical protein
MSELWDHSGREGRNTGKLKRREFIKLCLCGAALSCLNLGCETKSQPGSIPQNAEVYELTNGRTLYDDFDGNGSLQTYNNQNLAESGRLSSRLWDSSEEAKVVQDPASAGLITVVNEDGIRVEYRRQEGEAREIMDVYDAEGRLVRSVPHIPGEPYHSSKRLIWVGARDGHWGAKDGVPAIRKGKICGSAEVSPSGERGWVLRLTSSEAHLIGSLLADPRRIDFADFKTFSADVMVPSTATARNFYVALDYHTTIPEQPPGKSWVSDIGLHKLPSNELNLFAQCANVNDGGNAVYFILGPAQFDTWYNVRQDIVSPKEDPTLTENQLRIEYYVDGVLKETQIPEDSEILLDPNRTGWGPDRLLINFVLEAEGEGVGYFDNIRAVYKNRTK